MKHRPLFYLALLALIALFVPLFLHGLRENNKVRKPVRDTAYIICFGGDTTDTEFTNVANDSTGNVHYWTSIPLYLDPIYDHSMIRKGDLCQ